MMEGVVESTLLPHEVKWMHPFTCIVTGPSGSGKTTFVKELLCKQDELISTKFDKIYIFLGTELSVNKIFEKLQNSLDNVSVVELPSTYPQGLKEGKFKENFIQVMKENSDQQLATCVIFDDLMAELAEVNLLDEMFTKWSSHGNMSVIHITQNIFHKGKGSQSQGTTIYRNAKVLVLFYSPMDHTTLNVIASRLAKGGKRKHLLTMLSDILERFRYVCIRANLQTPKQLKYTTDLFATEPFRHIKNFSLLQE